MIKYAISTDCLKREDTSKVSWVSKRVLNCESKKAIGLSFHKVTPLVQNVIIDNIESDGRFIKI